MLKERQNKISMSSQPAAPQPIPIAGTPVDKEDIPQSNASVLAFIC